jgi:hypothetical protein
MFPSVCLQGAQHTNLSLFDFQVCRDVSFVYVL